MPEITQMPPKPEQMLEGPPEQMGKVIADAAQEMPRGHQELYERLSAMAVELDPDQVMARMEPVVDQAAAKRARTMKIVKTAVVAAAAVGLTAAGLRSGKATEIIGKLAGEGSKLKWLGKPLKRLAEGKVVQYAAKPAEAGVKVVKLAGEPVQKGLSAFVERLKRRKPADSSAGISEIPIEPPAEVRQA
ncbi:hypothetical protein A2Z33_03575 [Candidatus Gottesmanbacteria bacterium RBG_16_52_11]|uniref:Uncharacterized protein n=1 Tax=Candidatus Gottesmanbacteria bacterium RBG_16_52_11 TaxID=1798374 RepID=A0A1F5YW61_9BACT|nr:MAG: hypothetical protein A2Z33_03575 [Candidatus Gottesmanbacteria bacterium RBG_16_52_11]